MTLRSMFATRFRLHSSGNGSWSRPDACEEEGREGSVGEGCRACCALQAREQGGVEALSKEDVKLHSLITLKELLGYMKENGMIDEDKYNKILIYLKQNAKNNKT